jgi:hypothetical protein
MTEPHRTNAEPSVSESDVHVSRQDRWRAGTASAGRPASRRIATGAALALAALAAVVLSTALIVAPLFSWQTAGIALVVDDYSLDMLPTVPFAPQDTTALATSLSGRLAPAMSGELMQIKGFDTVEAMRDRLHGLCVELPIRGKDSMIAYVRGQCLVPPPLLDPDGNERPDPLGGHACLVASDATLRGEGLRELVPCRDIVESIGSAPSLTTLVAMDLGDLRWDPRIGVLCSQVPRQLDQDFKAPPIRANGQNWLMTSHDNLQYSGASGTAKRTFFAAALEQGLAGAADQSPWGDGDRVVELHELAPFVVAWTSEWSRRGSGGRAPQRPAIWKLGVGRVALADIPRNIRLVRVAPTPGAGGLAILRRLFPGMAPAKPTPPPAVAPVAAAAPPVPAAGPTPAVAAGVVARVESAAAQEAATAAAAVAAASAPPQLPSAVLPAPAAPLPPTPAPATVPPSAATPQPTDTASQQAKPATASQAQTLPAGPAAATVSPPPAQTVPPAARSTDPWDLLASMTNRIGPPPGSVPQPSVIDFAPHLWRQAASFVAAATTDAAFEGPAAERARAALQRFQSAMKGINDPSSAEASTRAGSPPAEALSGARRAATLAGIPQAWSSAPKPFQAATAARNDAVEIGWAMLDVIGKLSGGAGPQLIEAGLIDRFIDRISRLSNVIAQTPPIAATDQAISRLDPFTTATQNMISQTSLMRSLQDQLLANLTAEAGSSAQIPLHDRMILLRSRLPDAAQRAKLLPITTAVVDEATAATAAANDAGAVLKADGRPLLPSGPPRTIDRAAWKHSAALAAAIVDLIDASGINASSVQNRTPAFLQPTLDDIAAARRAIAALENAAGDDAAGEAAAKLSSRMARLFERAAAAAARVSDTAKSATNAIDSDRIGGLLRILDPRDAAAVGDRVIVGLTRWNTETRYGLRVQQPDAAATRLGIATDIQISVADANSVPAAATLTLGFDPAQVAVRLPDGTKLREGISIPTHDLPWRGGVLSLQVVPLRRATSGDKASATLLNAVLAVDDYAEKAQHSLPLPSERRILVAARGGAGSVSGIAAEDGWIRASRAAPMVRGIGVDEAMLSLLSLSGQSARVTGWQLGLGAPAGDVRKVDVELHSIPATQTPHDRERAWADTAAALLDGRFTGKPLARAAGVSLGAGGEIVPLVLKPDDGSQTGSQAGAPGDQKKAGGPTAPQSTAAGSDASLELPAPQSAAGEGIGREVGPDLALVIRDTPAVAGERPMITRISLSAQHPRDLISAVARYDQRGRTITVSLEPVGGNATILPPDGTQVTLREPDGDSTPGGAPSSGVRLVVPRKPGAVLTATAPSNDVIASWNGPDQGTARFSLDVDGYPRAFNFAVDCSSAADRQPQGPQHDWRQIRILAPTAGTTLLKAPVASVPMKLAVDAPADTFLGGESVGGSVAIVLRQIGAGLGDRGEERTVWNGGHDREVTFTLEPPPAGMSLGIKTLVDDWSVAASGEGFANVDVSAEARLVIAGFQSALVDSRILVFDGQAPVVVVPTAVQATVGKPVVVPIQASDDSSDGYLIPPERRRPGVSGLKAVEWAIDVEGKGTPKEWQPAVWLGGTNYEVRIDSAKLPFGVRLPVLVRATDAVGLSDPPSRIWLEVAAEAASKLNSITGKVMLAGRGEPNLPVALTGPGGDRTARSTQGGVFRFDDLEPGQYKVSVQAAVRNQVRKAEPTPVTVEPAPAPAASVTLELK